MDLKSSYTELVKQFMIKMQQIQSIPSEGLSESEAAACKLRLALLIEQVDLMFQAFLTSDSYQYSVSPLFKTINSYIHELSEEDLQISRIGVLQALADMQYINTGTSVLLNLPLEQAFQAVHENNMTKIDPITGTILRREDGKIIKPVSYQPLNLKEILDNNVST